VEAARLMAGDYMATRYPDISEEIPAETYSSDDAKERVAAADVLFCWARGILQ
jgi:HEPN domain-containing protein